MKALRLLLLALFCACSVPLPAQEPGTLQSGAELATVVLMGSIAQTDTMVGPICAAVAIGPHTLVTARHCVKRHKVAFATNQDWVANDWMGEAETTGAIDEANDLILLRTRETLANTVAIRTDALTAGDQVYSVHHGSLMPWSFVVGTVANGDRTDGEIHMVQVDIAVSPGASGAGLFDRDGKLAGVLSERDSGFAYFAAGWKVRDLVLKPAGDAVTVLCLGGRKTCF